MSYTQGSEPAEVIWNTAATLWIGFLLLESGYLIDANGGRIILDGGIPSGENETPVTWIPGD